jgi:SAM-dependent methyltransferase
MARPPSRDPTRAQFWDERYQAGFIPWDAGSVPHALIDFVGRRAPGPRVLVPGCGSAYEAGWLDAQGFRVTAIDISTGALERARTLLGAALAERVLRQADFFEIDAEFDWIYERALLAALPPARWAAYADNACRLLAPAGLLAGFFFIDDAVDEARRGPPFAVRRQELVTLFDQRFDRVEDVAIPREQSIDVFAGRERWMLWRLR